MIALVPPQRPTQLGYIVWKRMRFDLEAFLVEVKHLTCEPLTRAERARAFKQWSTSFAPVERESIGGLTGATALAHYLSLPKAAFFVLIDDRSGHSSFRCTGVLPDLTALVSESVGNCDRVVVLDCAMRWAMVFEDQHWRGEVDVLFQSIDSS